MIDPSELLQLVTAGAGCSHVSFWKRLRSKRGHAYFVCVQCGSKWRVPTTAPCQGCTARDQLIVAMQTEISRLQGHVTQRTSQLTTLHQQLISAGHRPAVDVEPLQTLGIPTSSTYPGPRNLTRPSGGAGAEAATELLRMAGLLKEQPGRSAGSGGTASRGESTLSPDAPAWSPPGQAPPTTTVEAPAGINATQQAAAFAATLDTARNDFWQRQLQQISGMAEPVSDEEIDDEDEGEEDEDDELEPDPDAPDAITLLQQLQQQLPRPLQALEALRSGIPLSQSAPPTTGFGRAPGQFSFAGLAAPPAAAPARPLPTEPATTEQTLSGLLARYRQQQLQALASANAERTATELRSVRQQLMMFARPQESATTAVPNMSNLLGELKLGDSGAWPAAPASALAAKPPALPLWVRSEEIPHVTHSQTMPSLNTLRASAPESSAAVPARPGEGSGGIPASRSFDGMIRVAVPTFVHTPPSGRDCAQSAAMLFMSAASVVRSGRSRRRRPSAGRQGWRSHTPSHFSPNQEETSNLSKLIEKQLSAPFRFSPQAHLVYHLM